MNIREIARRAGVSHSTVSRVINDVATVDPRLTKRVRAVIDEAGYRPNYQAQALARGRSHTIGLIVSEVSGGNPFFAEIILYFERAAVRSGYEVLVSFADTETNPEHIAICAQRMRERQVEGVAVLTFGMEDSLAQSASGLPMVFAGVNNVAGGVRNISINYLTGMRAAVQHLADFGHERIGYLSGQLSMSSMEARHTALRKAIRLAGLTYDRGLLADCKHTLEGGARGMAILLNLPKPPSAVVCCNDMAAIGALKTLNERGLQAGKDISLIGFDDLTLCEFMHPALSTICFSPHELADLACRALLEAIDGGEARAAYEYKTRLILRESTGPNLTGKRA